MIQYKKGDATNPPREPHPAIIAHICNDHGGWGAGFVLAISNRWKAPENAYRAQSEYELGTTQLVMVEPNLFVANMIAQHGYASPANPCAVSYPDLLLCLAQVRDRAAEMGAIVHMPKIGAGLAGGDWTTISNIIETVFKDTIVFVYEFNCKGK